MPGQQVARCGDRVLPAQAGTEEDRQQFGVRQLRGTAGEQALARTFVDGPVADQHASSLPATPLSRHRGATCVRVSLCRALSWGYSEVPMTLQGQRVLLCVCGGIAAYKAADLVRRLRDAGAEVRVVLTESAARFVTPLTFQALSGHPVRHGLWDEAAEAAMGHIELARWADILLVAPASADLMARLA